MLIAGFGRRGHAVGDIPGVRFKVGHQPHHVALHTLFFVLFRTSSTAISVSTASCTTIVTCSYLVYRAVSAIASVTSALHPRVPDLS